jgi:hypothetical protein
MNTRFRSNRRRSLLIVALMLCCATLIVRAHRKLNSEGQFTSVAAGVPLSTPVKAAQGGTSPRNRAVYFRITPLGIEPAELTLPAGRYLVAIDNDSGFNALDVKIDKEGGPRLGNAQLPSGRRKWREFVDFTPGRHVLTDPTDTKRVCYLTITDQ